MADATCRIRHIAAVPRDDVHVEVHDGLTGRRATVDPDVVTVRRWCRGVQLALHGFLLAVRDVLPFDFFLHLAQAVLAEVELVSDEEAR